jgi:hypothetical protein
MKNRLFEIKSLVKEILEDNEKARDSDSILYLQICYMLNPSVTMLPFGEVIARLDAYGLPPFESVRRARQKIQAERPDLRACDEVELFRAENETAYKEFATN